jgi:hypothetical protein
MVRHVFDPAAAGPARGRSRGGRPGAVCRQLRLLPRPGWAGANAGRKVHAKDLTLSKLTDAEIERQIREGTKDSRGLATMPAFKDQLSDAEITALVPVVKSFRK